MANVSKRKTAAGEWRYDVEYVGPDDRKRSRTFKRRKDADTFLRSIETELAEGAWINPDAGKVALSEYATQWLRTRRLSPRTRELYEGQLRLHILATLGDVPLNRLTPGMVREWHASLFEKGRRGKGRRIGPNTIAKCYRLLHTIMETAVDDELVRRNPCRIERGGRESYEERPTVPVAQVYELAAAVKPERRLLVLLAAFTGLRVAELFALRRRHVDILHRRLLVKESTVELRRGELVTKGPKSDAGVRRVHLDRTLLDDMRVHLDEHTGPAPDAYLFTGDKGGQLRRAVWFREWDAARRSLGLAELHFHDLRHTHGTLVATSGGTMKETMRRLGHSTIQAAMVYQHATDERDQELAEAIGERIAEELRKAEEKKQRENGESKPGEQAG